MVVVSRVCLLLACGVVPYLLLASDDQRPVPMPVRSASLEATKAEDNRETKAGNPLDGPCVCPKWKYATYPTYSSYYAKRCDPDTMQVTYVSYDTPDLGTLSDPAPDCQCPPVSCTAGCFTGLDVKRIPGKSSDHETEDEILGTQLKHPLPYGYSPLLQGDTRIIKSFAARVNLDNNGDKSILVKLFQILPSDPNGGPLKVFGGGVEVSSGLPLITIPWNKVTPVVKSAAREDTGCHFIRFEIDTKNNEHLVLAKTEFQVITSQKIPILTEKR